MYVSDAANRIQKFDSSGNLISRWGSYGSGNGQFCSPVGITIDSDDFIYVVDQGNKRIQKFDRAGNFISSFGISGNIASLYGVAAGLDSSLYVADATGRIHKMLPASGTDILFSTTIPVDQYANTTQDYHTAIGTLNTEGKLYLREILKNSFGQLIVQDQYPFYMVKGNIVLQFNTDKRIYKQGETVTVTGDVINLASTEATGLSLGIKRKAGGGEQENMYTADYSIPAQESRSFTFIMTTEMEGTITLTGTVTQNTISLAEIIDQYEVATSKVSVTVLSRCSGKGPV